MSPAGAFRLQGWHVLAIMVAFFGVIFTVNIAFTVIALKTFPGQVAVNPYEDGIAFNRTIAEQAAQERLGWRASAAAESDGSIVVKLIERAGNPVRGLKVEAKLQRPATEAGAVMLAFFEEAPGIYRARPGRLSGAWDLTFVARGSRGRFQAQRRMSWP